MSSFAANSSTSPNTSNADRETTHLAPNTPNATTSVGKVKQTRKRQRLSCVECTKRRQKCDRQFPCGLCTSRGIPHLCRWEPIVARPEPQRPPAAALAGTQMTIATLTARIAALEQELSQAKNAIEKNERGLKALESSATPISPSIVRIPQSDGNASGSGSPESGLLNNVNIEKHEPRALLDYDVQAAAVALAQLSLAPKTEFVGNGSVLSAIHTLGDFESWRFPYSSSSLTNLVTTVGHRNVRRERAYQSMMPQLPCTCDPDLFPGRRLAALMPSRSVVEELISAWFTERNWQYGLSEGWFMSGLQEMWSILERPCDPSCILKGGCDACTVDINPHWMCLLFSMLAIAPTPKKSTQDRISYFQNALEGRRYMDDMLTSPADYAESEYSVHGAALTIIATSFLAMYLAESGRLSEAWKLAGCGLRHAQALGMHRDPGWQKWQNMHQLERELRLAGWWWIVISDRFWSFALGRPPMVLKDTYDVIPEFTLTHADGTPNHNAVFVNVLLNLSEIVGDIAAECFGPYTPPYDKVFKLEERLTQWEQQVPDIMHWSRGTPVRTMVDQCELADYSSPAARRTRWLLYQRYTLSAWYLGARMNLHRPYVTQAPPILPLPGSNADPKHLNPSRDKCIETATVLTRLMCEFQEHLEQLPNPCRLVDASTFTYFTFDGAVACAGALTQNPPHPKKDECLALIDRAISVLTDISGAGLALEGACEAAKRGVVVLKTLKKAAGCDEHGGERGELVLLEDMLRKQRSANSNSSSVLSIQLDPPPYTALWTDPGTSTFTSTSSERSHEPMYTMPHESHQSAFHSTQPSLIPYLRSSFSDGHGPPPIDPSPFTVPTSNPSPMSTDVSTEMPWGSSLNAWGSAGIASRPHTQTVVTPFEVLQGVDMGASDTSEVDLNWARLAGMDSWFSLHGQHGGQNN